MNLYTQLSGFILGVMMSVICLPYITFNHWHSKARLVIIVVFTLLVIFTLIVAVFLFHGVQPDGIGSRNSFRCILDNDCDSGAKILNAL